MWRVFLQKEKYGHTHTRRTPHPNEGRGEGGASTSQGTLRIPSNCQTVEEGLEHPPSQPSEGANPADSLTSDSGPQNCEKITLCCWSFSVCGTLLRSPGIRTHLWIKNPRICKQGPLIMNGREWAPTWMWGSFSQVSRSTSCLHHNEYKWSLFVIKCKMLGMSGSSQVFNKLTSTPRGWVLTGRTVVLRTVSAYAPLTAIFLGAPLLA